MTYWKDWLNKIKDPTRDIYDRRYRLLALFYIVLLFVWLVSYTILFFNPARVAFILGGEAVFSLVYYLGLKYDRTQPAAVITSLMIVFIIMPLNFFTNGGIGAGATFWFLINLTFITMMVKGVPRAILVASDVTITAALHLFSYFRPDLIRTIERERAHASSFVSTLFTGVIIMAAIAFQAYTERQGRRILEEQRDEIADLNRAQNQFFSSMSHEIRTPINTIIGLNEMNLRDMSISDEMRTNNRNIQGASRMLLALINDILDMSKIESGKMEIVPVTYDVGALLSEVVNMIWARAEEKKLQFHVEVDESLPSQLYGDEVRIKQVLINLLNNAVKYTKEGSVRLTVQSDRLDERHARITWRVEDTGMGIKKEAIPHLFDAFKRVDEAANRNIEGTGLGLSIVKQIVDLMNGEISVDSVYTKGSTFTFSVVQEVMDDTAVGNVSLRKKRFAAEQDAYHQSFEAPDASLLIVDDNELNLQVESSLLQATKLQIDLARSGKECLSRTFRKRYDVIFMDHLMPEMDGIETLREVRIQRGGLNRETPVIVLTANAGSENQKLYTESGFDGYLLKPVSGQQLESALLGALPKDKVILTGTATIQGTRETIVGQHRNRKRILVSSESAADLPPALTEKYHIPIINYYVQTGGGVFFDDRDMDSDGLMEYLDKEGHDARSDAPSVSDYERFFAEQLTNAQQIIHVTYDRNVSAAYVHAAEAAGAFNNVHVFDSGALSSGTGLLALYAAYSAEHAEQAEELLARMEQVKRQIRTSFVVDSAYLLAKGGRISETVYRMANALMLHPMLKIGEKGMSLGGLFSGEHEKYRRDYIRKVLKNSAMIDTSLLFVTYVGMSEDELADIRALIEDEISFDRIIFRKASSAVAVNCGRGTFGLLYRVRGEGQDARPLYDFLPRNTGQEEEAEEEALLADEETMYATDEAVPQEERADTATGLPAREQADSGTALARLYASTDALDYQEAMKYLADEALMEKTLRQFYESISGNADEIERFLAEEDFDNFTIKVHALKSAARLVGAEDLSEMARKLEDYAKLIRG
ncbi:MAG: DegV family EDD domain-containing protein [Butyrivibrio sp.]|nr:DegV family EDD domain-containing protein [Butyrivibrio sp.]